MKRKQRNVNLERLVASLNSAEAKRVSAFASTEASHCTPMGCNITGCAVLCDGMSCPDFEHSCGVKNVGCVALIKCRGFVGDGDKCKAFETLPVG